MHCVYTIYSHVHKRNKTDSNKNIELNDDPQFFVVKNVYRKKVFVVSLRVNKGGTQVTFCF